MTAAESSNTEVQPERLLLVAACGGQRCRMLRQLHNPPNPGMDTGASLLRDAVRQRRDAVLISTGCLNACSHGSVVVVGWATMPKAGSVQLVLAPDHRWTDRTTAASDTPRIVDPRLSSGYKKDAHGPPARTRMTPATQPTGGRRQHDLVDPVSRRTDPYSPTSSPGGGVSALVVLIEAELTTHQARLATGTPGSVSVRGA